MTADTSWYGQQTLVHPDYSHEPYPAFQAYADPYAGHQQTEYYQQAEYYPQPQYYVPPQHYPQPEYYAEAQHSPTLVAEYPAYQDHGHQYSGYGHPGAEYAGAGHPGTGYSDAHYPDSVAPHAYYQDYSAYETVTDLSFAALQPEWMPEPSTAPHATHDTHDTHDGAGSAPDAAEEPALEADDEALPDDFDRAAARGSRRRATRRRSAVLTIAVPSVVVLGVAGAAAATIGPLRAHHTANTASTADAAAQTKAQALASAEARDAAERAARDKARTALQLRNAAARKTAAEAPRYTLPIAYHTGLSALFGQAGTHWMQLHTGIDFPVPVGTPVHAATGGTITTEWNPFYGYMVKLTAPDGTVTWYCHLSSYRVRSGHVKVGEIIAYSGDTGNSTGPHLHFEVHPDGGPAVDPLPWLLARGLDPR